MTSFNKKSKSKAKQSKQKEKNDVIHETLFGKLCLAFQISIHSIPGSLSTMENVRLAFNHQNSYH